MHVETYIEMKKTFLDLTGPDSTLWLVETNPLFSIVYDRDESSHE